MYAKLHQKAEISKGMRMFFKCRSAPNQKSEGQGRVGLWLVAHLEPAFEL
jgi:hypothetical protein